MSVSEVELRCLERRLREERERVRRALDCALAGTSPNLERGGTRTPTSFPSHAPDRRADAIEEALQASLLMRLARELAELDAALAWLREDAELFRTGGGT